MGFAFAKQHKIKKVQKSIAKKQVLQTGTSLDSHLVKFVDHLVSTLHFTSYQLGGSHIDTSKGVYILDCSRFIDYLLESIYPRAYANLTNNTGTIKPSSQDYFYFFNQLPNHAERYWKKIKTVKELKAGDVLVFRYKSKIKKAIGGHVMIVMDKPRYHHQHYSVRIADSASSGHSNDTRKKSGVGVGTLLLKANSKTGEPYAYAWKINSAWEKNIVFAMARPIAKFSSIGNKSFDLIKKSE